MKIKWRVQPAPTGKWRSFDRRGWPMAETATGDPVFRLDCADDYKPANVRTGSHAEIEIRVRCGATAEDRAAGRGGWRWRRLVRRAKTLDEAKAIAAQFVAEHPDHDFGM